MTRSVKSAKRALEILELYERLRRPAGVNEMADLLGYPQSSTSMLVNSLKNLGYLSYNPADRTFAPSMRIALIGEWIRLGEVGRSELLELMNHLQRDTGGTVILSTRHMTMVQYIHIVAPTAPQKADRRVRPARLVCAGALRPICRVAAGFVLLAECGDAEISKLVRSINAEASGSTVEELPRVMRDVERARELGYGCAVGGVLPTTGSIAIRLPYDDMFGKPLVLSISGQAAWIRENEEGLGRAMRNALTSQEKPLQPDQGGRSPREPAPVRTNVRKAVRIAQSSAGGSCNAHGAARARMPAG
jgi:DNA-binding IclR family transcriptional regulator